MMMTMQPGPDELTKTGMLQAKALSAEARGVSLNLGKKISVPRDVMMEELNLQSNRGSRMFQERQKRVERFTLENAANINYNNNNDSQVLLESSPHDQNIPEPQAEKENKAFIAGKHSLVINLQKTVAKKGSPDVLAPGYSGPLKDIPREKFNATVIPKSYCSPWREALGTNETLDLTSLTSKLPQLPQGLQHAHYRCFNRAAMPFGGPMTSKRVIPAISFDALDPQNLPSINLNQMARRPNFNRAPRGWGINYCPESNEL